MNDFAGKAGFKITQQISNEFDRVLFNYFEQNNDVLFYFILGLCEIVRPKNSSDQAFYLICNGQVLHRFAVKYDGRYTFNIVAEPCSEIRELSVPV